MEISSYIAELIETERRDNGEFRDEIREDFKVFREWMLLHEERHASTKRLWQLAGAVLATSITITAGIVIPILLR